MLGAWLVSRIGAETISLGNPNATIPSCSSWSEKYQQYIWGVCVCNTTSECDTVSNEYKGLSDDEAIVYRTTKAGLRLATEKVEFIELSGDHLPDLTLNTSKQYQEILGIGGAFSDSTAINVNLMEDSLQEELVNAYFGEDGIQYTIGRVPMAVTDFSTHNYTYDNSPVNDFNLSQFSIEDDLDSKIPFINRVQEKTNRNLTIFSSVWVPPSWMAEDGNVFNGALKGYPGSSYGEYWSSWALYFSKFLTAYKEQGIDIWAVNTQNEPNYISYIEKLAVLYNSSVERDWIKNDLGPVLARDHPDVKIIAMDDWKEFVPEWNETFLDEEASSYVSGIGIHSYSDNDFIEGYTGDFDLLADFHDQFPDKFILSTESCEGFTGTNTIGTGTGVRILEPEIIWWRATNYMKDLIGSFQNYVTGWTDWNMVLDTDGGPNWQDNQVDAPILVDTENKTEYYKQPMYYVMGHFAKFLTPGSVHVDLVSSSSVNASEVSSVAFTTSEDQVAIIIANYASEETSVLIQTEESKGLNVSLPAYSLQSILFNEKTQEAITARDKC